MGLYAAVEGIGSFLAILLVQLMRFLQLGWINDEQDFNSGHMDYFFYLLAVVQLVSVIVLALILYLRSQHHFENHNFRLKMSHFHLKRETISNFYLNSSNFHF